VTDVKVMIYYDRSNKSGDQPISLEIINNETNSVICEVRLSSDEFSKALLLNSASVSGTLIENGLYFINRKES